MKTFLITLSFALVSLTSFSQDKAICGMDLIRDRAFTESGLTKSEFAEEYYPSIDPNFEAPITRATYTIPVVVHVLHNNGTGNISEAQILDALDIITTDYQRLNADAANTRNTAEAPFLPYAGSLDVEFKLAKYDENGNCTNGIERINTTLADNADMNDEPHKYTNQGGLDAWDPNRYFNIWVVNTISDPTLPPGYFVGGYAQFPGFGAPETYGVTIRADKMGSIEVANGDDGRTLTHEAGHCFGLLHIFESFLGSDCDVSTNCNNDGDQVCDTPPQGQDYYNCDQTLNSCIYVPNNDAYGFNTLDQIENFMSYNTCTNMFSMGQMDRMENVLNNYLGTVISASNIAFTGVNEPGQICQADFTASNQVICAGTDVQFTDYSYFFPVAWTWSVSPGTEGVDYTFTGGTNANSQNPQIQFLTEGMFSVSLEVSDGSNSVSNTETDLITVLPVASQIPFLETFEGISDLNATNKWTPVLNSGTKTFQIFNGFGHTGSRCTGINNFAQSGGSSDLIASPVDLSVLNPGAGDIVTLTFRYAYRKRNASNDEWLRVYISNDCGNTWALRKTLHGNTLGSQTSSSSWQPSSQSDWETVHVLNITEAYMTDNFMYKFSFDGSGGNNIYIDNINIYPGAASDDLVIGIDESELFTNFHMYPNPSHGELNLGFSSETTGEASIEILDIAGKIISVINTQVLAGNNQININTLDLATGSYLLTLKLDGGKITRRFIKE